MVEGTKGRAKGYNQDEGTNQTVMTNDELEEQRKELLRIVDKLLGEKPPGDAPVPAKKNPGPKGRSGGAAAERG